MAAVILVMLALPLALAPALAGPLEDDQRFLDGLRERRLFRQAESYCREHLADASIAPQRQAALVVEWSRALAGEAIQSQPQEARALWQQAAAVTEQFAAEHPQHPRLILVETQGALVALADGEQLADQIELAPGDQALAVAARARLQAAVAALRKLSRAAAGKLRAAAGAAGTGPHLSPAEASALANHLRYQLARAYRRLATIYTPQSPDRADALTQAAELLGPLAQLPTTHPLAWESRLDEIACYRLLEDEQTATRRLDVLDRSAPPPSVVLRARAERARLALARGKIDEALALLDKGREIEGPIDPEFDDVSLQTCLAAWQAAQTRHDNDEAADMQARVEGLVEAIKRAHGPFWAQRAQTRLATAMAAGAGSSDPALLARAAQMQYRAGQIEQALSLYDRAWQQAAQSGDAARAFDWAYLAATIEHHRGDFDQAAGRYRAAALKWPENSRAADAHLLAAHDRLEASKGAASEPQNTLAVQPYLELLEEHLRLWPRSSTVAEARWRLGQVYEYQHAWQQAIDAYRGIAPDQARAAVAVEATARAYEQLFAQRKSSGQDYRTLAAEAARYFERLADPLPRSGEPPKASAANKSGTRRAAAQAAGRIWLELPPEGYARAEGVLGPILDDPLTPPDWRAAALSVYIMAVAGQGRLVDAERRLAQTASQTPRQLLVTLAGLSRLGSGSDAARRRELAGLELRLVEQLKPHLDKLSPQEQRDCQLAEARALAWGGQAAKARAAYAALAKAHPRDTGVLAEEGEALSAGGDANSLRAALDVWRQLEQHSEPGSPRWFRAKYQLALAHHRLGNDDRAKKIIALTELLHPELGGREWQEKFQELREQCQR